MIDIHEDGLIYNSTYLMVDFDKWTTQAALRKKLGVTKNRISTLVIRRRLKSIKIEQLNLVLVPNLLDVNELKKISKKPKKSD